jgi:hypothetical protein
MVLQGARRQLFRQTLTIDEGDRASPRVGVRPAPPAHPPHYVNKVISPSSSLPAPWKDTQRLQGIQISPVPLSHI